MRYALAVLMLCVETATAQPRGAMSGEAHEVFVRWMASTCIGDDAGRWSALLQRHRGELEPAFRRALADGPPDDLVARVRRAADARYAAIAAAPAAQVRVTGETVRTLARPARQGYVDDEAARFAAGYRSNAIAGLAIVGGPQARAVLRRVAREPGSPLGDAAAEALKALAVR